MLIFNYSRFRPIFKSLFCIVVLVSAEIESASAGNRELARDVITGEVKNNAFFFHVIGGASYYHWKPGNSENALSFKTEGLSAYHLDGAIGYKGSPFLRANTSGPFSSSPTQKEMFTTNSHSREAAVKRYQWAAHLDPIVKKVFPKESFFSNLLRIRFDQSKELFFGNATAKTNVFYVPMDAVEDLLAQTINGGQTFTSGSTIAFRTEFLDREVSVPIYLSEEDEERLWLRVGYFTSSWRRPSEYTGGSIVNGLPTVYDTKFQSSGISLAFEPLIRSTPGNNYEISIRMGLKNTIDTASQISSTLNEDESIVYSDLFVSYWYNYYSSEDQEKGFFMTLKGDYRFRRWTIEDSTNTWDLEEETIVRLTLFAGARF